MTLRLLSWLCLLAPALGAAPASFVWVENPASTNFPQTARWQILSEGKAPAVTQVRDPSLANTFFIEYAFTIPETAGTFNLWGRSYDPNWSSPARWRIDHGAWQPWTPGPSVDRQVADRTYAMEWHQWARLPLAAGSHHLRIELTGLRKRGDVPFFVLDALLLAKGDFTPKGGTRPDALVADKLDLVRMRTEKLGESAKPLLDEAKALARKALTEDLGAVSGFARIEDEITRRVELEKIISENQVSALNGKVGGIVLAGRTLKIPVTWNRPLGTAKVWIGFVRQRALYEERVLSGSSSSREQTYEIELPGDLPSGAMTVQVVPIDEVSSTSALGSFDVPAALSGKAPLARAWGVYRDKNLRAHPWNVTEAGMMKWDGEPFLPVGGMINTRLSWQTHKGDAENSAMLRSGTALLKAQFRELRRYGLNDIYFNAFFPRADPSALAAAINTAEEAGMCYGLHVSSNPSRRSLAFHATRPLEIAAGATEAKIRYPVDTDGVRPVHRVIWALFSATGDVLESGKGVLHSEKSADPRAKNTTDLCLDLSLKPASAPRTLVFSPEVVTGRQDAVGYYAGIDDYIADLRETYGSLSYGPGMRLWIDPFQNELHARPNNVCTEPVFQADYAHWLIDRYGSLEKLAAAWGSRAGAIGSFLQAARLVPLHESGAILYCMDPETAQMQPFTGSPSSVLRDMKRFRGVVAQKAISRVADVLKEIANVPVILKHNTWFSDWFVNPELAGGQDGVGFEPYCYGDSLAYHNSLVPLAESLASARRQWAIVTETSAGAFDGQKNYVGYLDRLQMLDDFDQLLKFGAKGIYTFGFAFDPPLNFQVTELLRDPRQLEWLSTYRKTIDAAAPRLATYLPEVYGWYPANLREGELVGEKPPPYAMNGNYTQRAAQIRMAPDGRWIVPALRPDAEWKGVLAATDLLTRRETEALAGAPATGPLWKLGGEGATTRLNGFTANGIGVISPKNPWMTLDQFRQTVLGYRVFQTESLNGQTLPDGRVMVWTCMERERAEIRLPSGAGAVNVAGQALPLSQDGSLVLRRAPQAAVKGDLPDYLGHFPKGYYHPDNGQPEVAILSGVTVDQILAADAPAWHRWLPPGITADRVTAWQEAEQPDETTFTQPRVEGYSRYSGGAAIGINTYFNPPKGLSWFSRYALRTDADSSQIWMRRMDKPAMDIDVRIDGALAGTIPAGEKDPAALHLNVWNAGTGMNNIKVGWHALALKQPLPAGPHRLELVARPAGAPTGKADTALLGGQSDAETEAEAARIDGLHCVQIDALMLTR